MLRDGTQAWLDPLIGVKTARFHALFGAPLTPPRGL
jgi:hypothetical protein